MEYYNNQEKIKMEKLEKMQQMRSREIERMMETDEDIDMSSIGQKWEKRPFAIGQEENLVKEQIKHFLDIPYGLELISLGFVILVFSLLTFVRKLFDYL